MDILHFLIHSSFVDKYLDCFHFGDVMNTADMNTYVQDFV